MLVRHPARIHLPGNGFDLSALLAEKGYARFLVPLAEARQVIYRFNGYRTCDALIAVCTVKRDERICFILVSGLVVC